MKLLVALIAMLVVGGSACARDNEPIVVTADDNGIELVVASGGRIDVRLESNPSTGSSWRVNSQAIDAFARIAPVEYAAPPDDGRVGAAGTELFRVELLNEGAGMLRFEYIRSFDDPPVAARVVEYLIRVGDGPWPPEVLE
jgi:inhibitor of cysteine peptidase